jgi:hypothetical protein
MRQIELEWLPLGVRVTADLDVEENNNLIELLWSTLPYNSLQNHALVSGNHLYHLIPRPETIYTQAASKVPDRTRCADGTVFLSQLQHVAIKYGPLTEYLPAAPIGHVHERDIPLLREVGQACWEAAYQTKKVVEVRVRRAGDPTPAGELPRPDPVEHPAVQALIDEVRAETARIWVTPPQELLDIHAGRITSRAGSYDQYLSTLVFVNGEVRPLGYGALNSLVRLCATSDLNLAALQTLTPTFVTTAAEFLGYCGLNTLWRFTQQTVEALPLLTTKQEYHSLISALALYTNCLNTWNLHLFPWNLGDAFPFPPQNDTRDPRHD